MPQDKSQKLPVRHHYIPQCYLEGFSHDSARLNLFDKKAPTEDLTYRKSSIEAIAFEKKLYTYRTKNNEVETLEQTFSQIEGKAKSVIRKLNIREEISEQERTDLATFISLLYVRTPASKRESLNAQTAVMEKLMRLQSHLPKDIIKKQFEEAKIEISDKEMDDAIEFMQDEKRSRLSAEYPPEYWIKQMLELSAELLPYFLAFEWEIVHSDRKFAFITSDNPVILIPGVKPHPFYGVGLLTEHAKKILPLTADMCLVMHDVNEKDVLYHTDRDKQFTRKINEFIFKRANRFVFASDEAKLAVIAKTRKELVKPWENKFSVS